MKDQVQNENRYFGSLFFETTTFFRKMSWTTN